MLTTGLGMHVKLRPTREAPDGMGFTKLGEQLLWDALTATKVFDTVSAFIIAYLPSLDEMSSWGSK